MSGPFALLEHEGQPLLAIGALWSCPAWQGPVVHIWRDDLPHRTRCRRGAGHLERTPSDLSIRYEEGEPLEQDVLDALFAFASEHPLSSGRSLLVHCYGGETRSATLALVALAALTPSHPVDWIPHITRALWTQQGRVPRILPEPVLSILRWWDERTVISPDDPEKTS